MAMDFHRVQSVFQAVAELPPAERAAVLEREYGDDAELRRRVAALLQAHDDAGELPAANPEPTGNYAPAVEVGQLFAGRYKLREKLGEGGMGVVFVAEQTEPVQRRVALKVIRAGLEAHRLLARFEQERQALALMDHPNIAKVFDAGIADLPAPLGREGPGVRGTPFFAMELVKGLPLTRYCDEARLAPRQRLELFVPVCQAVQHAHQKGVIHRDLKPSNVLVGLYDGRPVPKVIDFGVAKATGPRLTPQSIYTEVGSIIGTFEYMSPEQAELNNLDVDTRSDIYALGVILYELLTGALPFSRKELETAGLAEMLRVIKEVEPPRPSTKLSQSGTLPSVAVQRHMEPHKLTALVRGELDWIVMKALEKDRSRRYETANGFAMDVQRYLADEPVQACPPSRGYRLRKFVRRNKRSLTMVAVVAGALLILVGAVGWMLRDRTAREQQLAQDREARQAVIRERVTLAVEEARKRHQEGRWKEALDAAKRAEGLAATGDGDEETRRRALEVLGDMQMLANLANVRARPTQDGAAFDLTEGDRRCARAFREYGIDIDALDRDEAAARIRARPIRFELALLLDSWSHGRRRLGSEHIGKDWRQLLEVARAADPDPWRDQLRQALLNDDRQALVELAATAPIVSLPVETVDRLGDALLYMGAVQEAAALLRKGQRQHPQDYWINTNLGICLSGLGPHHLDEAIRYYTAALALRPEAVLSHSNLGNALHAKGMRDEAVECYRKVIELDPNFSPAYYDLGNVLYAQKKPEDGARAFRLGLEHDNDLKQLLAQDSKLTPTTRRLMAYTAPRLLLVDDTDAYRRLCTRLIVGFGDTEGPDTAYHIARICALAPDSVSDPTQVVQIAERAVRAKRAPHYLHTLGLAYYRAGRFDQAIQHLHESITTQWNANVANWLVLAMAHQRLGHVDEARKWYDQAVAWIDDPGADALRSLHGLDYLACLVLRREAEMRLGPPPRAAPEGKKSPGAPK